MTTRLKIFLYIFTLFLVFAKPAHAYLDPGTGSYLFQFLIAGLLGGSFFFKNSFKSLFDRFKKDSRQKKEEGEPTKDKAKKTDAKQ